MPSSDARAIYPVLSLAEKVKPRTVIDAGAGRGKYGLLVREYLPTVETVDAIEVYEPYVSGWNDDREQAFTPLHYIYDDVMVGPFQTFGGWRRYDLALFIDVLEHLPRRQGEELISRVASSGAAAIYCTPRAFFQNPEADRIPSEKHRSLWTESDFPSASIHSGDERAVITLVPGGTHAT